MRVAIIGYGKMGREIERLLIERGHTVTLIIDAHNSADLCKEKLAGVDVAIEFSTPQTAFANIITCLNAGVAVVSGTTAWLEQYKEVEQKCQELDGAFFYSSNYSIGVNLLFQLNQQLAKLMDRFPEYDVTVNEVHHRQKKDAPSGTAITLAEAITQENSSKQSWQLGTTTEEGVLEITAQRRSTVPGTHTVEWESEVDRLTLHHQAKSRLGFAIGAVTAAEFLVGKKGVFTMSDLLKL